MLKIRILSNGKQLRTITFFCLFIDHVSLTNDDILSAGVGEDSYNTNQGQLGKKDIHFHK